MAFELKTKSCGNLLLTLFNFFIDEFFDTPATRADNMVVMCAVVDFIGRPIVAEVMTNDQPRRLKLRENTVNRCKPHFDVFSHKLLVNVFGRQVTLRTGFLRFLEKFQNPHPWRGRLQACVFELLFRL